MSSHVKASATVGDSFSTTGITTGQAKKEHRRYPSITNTLLVRSVVSSQHNKHLRLLPARSPYIF